MERTSGTLLLVAALILVAGCTRSSAPDNADPEKVVFQFLEAVRQGDVAGAARLLTPQAREKTASEGIEVAPPGSETASFKVLEVEHIAKDGAHVASQWSDVDDQGERHNDTIVWMLRKEHEGWRITGMATRLCEEDPPLFLNFEDPADMLQKQKIAEEQMARRAAQENLRASQREEPQKRSR